MLLIYLKQERDRRRHLTIVDRRAVEILRHWPERSFTPQDLALVSDIKASLEISPLRSDISYDYADEPRHLKLQKIQRAHDSR